MQAYIAQPSSLASRLFATVRGGNWGHKGGISTVPIPQIAPDQVLVKVAAAASNPSDNLHLDYISPGNAIIGCDYAGKVVKVGSEVTNWSVGDRIAGTVHGGVYTDRGAYAEYLVTDADLAWRIPESMSDEDASTFGVGALAAVQSLYLNLDVAWPDGQKESAVDCGKIIYIHGGSSSVGLFAIQLAKMAGMTVVTTCSPRNNDLVKSHGADHIYDYNTADVGSVINAAHPGITRCLDCISNKSTIAICNRVIGTAPASGAVIALSRAVPFAKKGKNVVIKQFFSYTMLGKPFALLRFVKFAASPKDRAALVKFYAMLPSLITEKNFKANPTQIRPGGLAAIEGGLKDLKAGKLSGKKLVYLLRD